MFKPLLVRGCALLTVAVTVAFLAGTTGCGGGDCCRQTQTSSAQTTRAVKFDVAWAERSRHVDAPNSAQSLRVRFIAAGDKGNTVSRVFNRPAGTQSVVQNVAVDEPVRVGSQEVIFQFYSEPGASGTLVGVARTFVTIKDDGTGADDIAVAGVVRSVSLPANQTLLIGEERDFPVTVRDGDGAVIALSPGSVFLSVRGGGDAVEVTADGRLRAKAAGTAAVVALVDGIESAAAQVTVTPNATTPRFTINWAARSRAVNALASARSCRVTLPGASPGGADVIVPVVNRRTTPGSYSQLVTIADPVTVGNRNFTAEFFADPDGQGARVGVATGQLPVNADGTGLDTFTLDTAASITSCEVMPNQLLAVGTTQLLNFTARDASGSIVPVTPGSAFWSQVEGDVIQVLQDGSARAAFAGEVKVRVSVDGATSEPTVVRATDSKGGINVDIL